MLTTSLCLAVATIAAVAAGAEPGPLSRDPRVTIECFAEAPDIVTPTGIAIDAAGRVLVVESHTHFPPADYAGPKTDRIRALVDTNGDGRADRVTNFYEGGTATMNLAVYEDGSVFVATRSEIFRLYDRDGDGVAELREPIARLETKGDYPHNGLSGFAFDCLGNVYFGLGENLGATYRLVGVDGQALTGGGEGGSIYRCRTDGSGLVRVSTGFWNPFHLCLDAYDRLFAVDNDPDSRPPCRLLHIVPGGDYGYRYRNGRRGIHPFTAWNGELPGTLPMTAGTGEAPSGVLSYDSDQLPEEYRGTLLVTSWGDHRIDRFGLEPRGASFRALAEPIITGGDNFRPVGIVLAADGSLFVSDWVDKSYELHGKGRVWHIRARDASPPTRSTDPRVAIRSPHRPLRQWAARQLCDAKLPPGQAAENRKLLAELAGGKADARVRADAFLALARENGQVETLARRIVADDGSTDLRAMALQFVSDEEILAPLAEKDAASLVRAAALRRLTFARNKKVLLAAVADGDPFLRQAARAALLGTTSVAEQLDLARADQPAVRLAALLVLRESGDPAAQGALPRLLADDDPDVRFAAVQWVAEAGLTEFRERITADLASGATTRTLFEAYLAALERLDGIKRIVTDEWSGEQYVLELLLKPDTAPAVRARALRAIRPDYAGLTLALLTGLSGAADLPTRVEAVRTMRERLDPEAAAALARLATDVGSPTELRAEAIVGLAANNPAGRDLLISLASDAQPAIRHEAWRSLRGAAPDDKLRTEFAAAVAKESDPELITRLWGEPPKPARPERADTAAWLALLQTPGDPRAGERIFFHPRGPACYRCHQVDGRGGTIGPELSTTPRSLSLPRLLESLLQPSKEIAPQFTVWNVVRKDGTTFAGILLAEEPDGIRRYGTAEGQQVTTKAEDIAEVRPQTVSIMPDGLCDLLTPGELRDLIAFLREQR